MNTMDKISVIKSHYLVNKGATGVIISPCGDGSYIIKIDSEDFIPEDFLAIEDKELIRGPIPGNCLKVEKVSNWDDGPELDPVLEYTDERGWMVTDSFYLRKERFSNIDDAFLRFNHIKDKSL